MNFNNYKFHPHTFKDLMSGAGKPKITKAQEKTLADYELRASGVGKKLTDKQAETLYDLRDKAQAPQELPKTVKSRLHDIFIQEAYGRKRMITSIEMEKGIEGEDEAIELYMKFAKKFSIKNEEELVSEEFNIEGTPDLIYPEEGVDIKIAYSMWTFFDKKREDEEADYYWQLTGYSILTGISKWKIARVLANTPDRLIEKEFMRYIYAKNLSYPASDEATAEIIDPIEDQFRKNHIFDDIPLEKRVKIFEFDITEQDRDLVKTRLKECIKYLNQLTL